jgi:hypothetical protein
MNELDRAPFAEAMYLLGDTFNEPVTELRIEGYFAALNDFEMQDINVAVRHAMRTCKFFPKPVELREMIAGNAEDAADAAWGAVLKEIRRVGYMGVPNLEPRSLEAVRQLWGGWRRLCETLPGEGPELVGWIKQFKATYASVERREQHQLTMASLHPNVRAFITSEQKRLS